MRCASPSGSFFISRSLSLSLFFSLFLARRGVRKCKLAFAAIFGECWQNNTAKETGNELLKGMDGHEERSGVERRVCYSR